jgi:hypothetical protein
MSVFSALRHAVLDLHALKQEFAIIGGIAVSVRTTSRTTSDIDVAVAAVGDPEAERLIADMRSRGYVVDLILDHAETNRLSTVRLRSPESGIYVDLLFASSGIEAEIARSADIVSIDGADVPIAKVGHLLVLKLLAISPQRARKDGPDLDELLRAADATELARARSAIRLVVARGFARGRDLDAALDAELARRAD